MYILSSTKELKDKVEQVKLEKGKVVVDIGCGNNPTNDADILVDLYLGTDRPSGGGKKLEHRGRPVFNADIQDLSAFENKSIDFVYSKHILEHVDFPDKACVELVRISKAGYIECPHPWDELTDILKGRSRTYHKWLVFVVGNTAKFYDKLNFSFNLDDPIHASCLYMLNHKIEQYGSFNDWEKVAIYRYFQELGDGRHTQLKWFDSFDYLVIK